MKPGTGPFLPKPILDPTHMSRLTPKADIDVQKLLVLTSSLLPFFQQNLNSCVVVVVWCDAMNERVTCLRR